MLPNWPSLLVLRARPSAPNPNELQFVLDQEAAVAEASGATTVAEEDREALLSKLLAENEALKKALGSQGQAVQPLTTPVRPSARRATPSPNPVSLPSTPNTTIATSTPRPSSTPGTSSVANATPSPTTTANATPGPAETPENGDMARVDAIIDKLLKSQDQQQMEEKYDASGKDGFGYRCGRLSRILAPGGGSGFCVNHVKLLLFFVA